MLHVTPKLTSLDVPGYNLDKMQHGGCMATAGKVYSISVHLFTHLRFPKYLCCLKCDIGDYRLTDDGRLFPSFNL